MCNRPNVVLSLHSFSTKMKYSLVEWKVVVCVVVCHEAAAAQELVPPSGENHSEHT